MKFPLGDCSSPTTLASNQNTAQAIVVATDVNWTNSGSPNISATDGSIATCAIGGCANPTVLATTQARPIGIAVDAMVVYRTNNANEQPGTGSGDESRQVNGG
jgi:hypothetical protein